MASPAAANPEASEVRRRGRQRLIGAVALVAILVVFVPMLLDSEPKPQKQGPTLAIPSKSEAPPLPAPPAPAKGADAPAAQGTSAPAKADAQPPEAAKAEPPKVAAVAPRTDPKVAESKVLEPAGSKPPAPKAAPPAPASPAPGKAAPGQPPSAAASADAAPRLEGFAVQVGAFRDTAKLDQARQKLAAAKVPHYTERLDAKDGPLTRLRAGPFPSREAAEAALATIKRTALEGKVVPLP